MMIVVATLFLCVGLINLDFSRRWWTGQRLRLAIGVPLVALYCYTAMPPLVFPQALSLLLLTFVPNAAYGLLEAGRAYVFSRAMRRVHVPTVSFLPYVVVLAALAVWLAVLALAPVVDASGLRDLAAVSLSTAPPPPATADHLRVVPEVTAAFEGDKVIGQLGSYYQIDPLAYNVQPVNGRLSWVAALQFRDFIKWLTRRTVPGVVMVSAERPDEPAHLLLGQPMTYVPSAFLWDDLRRHVYSRFGYRQILELTLQLDDHQRPMYLATLGRPTIGWSGSVVTGVVLVDPVSGDMTHYAREEFARLPSWVKRVYPPDLVWQYNEWFGLYAHGWFNAQFAQRDVHIPAREEVFGVTNPAGEFVWFVDHTSPSQSDRSMTGYTFTDTVTGKMTYYSGFNGYFNSAAAESSVHQFPTVRQAQLVATQPVLYNLYGHPTWIVPAVAANGKYQTLGLVLADGGHTVVGAVNAPNTQLDALVQLQSFLGGAAASAPGAAASRRSGVVDRVALLGDALYLTVRGDPTIFKVEPAGPRDALTRAGDRVDLTLGSDATRVVKFFDRSL